MKKVIVFLAAFTAGISLSMEGAIGGVLGQHIGEMEASLYVFLVAFLILSPFVLLFRRRQLSQAFKLPKWQLAGGLFGGFYLVLLFLSVVQLGVGVSMTVVIIGQILASILIDHFGWLGTSAIKFNQNRFIAIILLFSSLAFVL